MKSSKALLIAAGIAAASVSSASAATTYATLVDYNTVGTIAADRKVTSNALGAPDGKFLSLELGGWAVFSFGTSFTGPSVVVEVTNGSRAGYLETAKVYGDVLRCVNPDPAGLCLVGYDHQQCCLHHPSPLQASSSF